MARKVFVSSDMAHDERLIEVAEKSAEAALIWPWIITYFDDWGRAEAHPKRIKAQIFPMNDVVTPELIERALSLFADAGLITLYDVSGKTYMAVPSDKWWKYQTHIHRSKREHDQSKFPPPPATDNRETARDSAELRENPRDFAPSPSTLPPFHPTPTLTDSYVAEREEERAQSEPDAAPSQSVSLADDGDMAHLAQSYRRIFNQDLGPMQFETLRFWREEKRFPADVICEAMRDAADKGKRFAYAEGILRNWDANNIRSLDAARQARNGRTRAPTERRLSALELAAQAKGGRSS